MQKFSSSVAKSTGNLIQSVCLHCAAGADYVALIVPHEDNLFVKATYDFSTLLTYISYKDGTFQLHMVPLTDGKLVCPAETSC